MKVYLVFRVYGEFQDLDFVKGFLVKESAEEYISHYPAGYMIVQEEIFN